MLQVVLERPHFVERELMVAGQNLELKILVAMRYSVSRILTVVDHPCG